MGQHIHHLMTELGLSLLEGMYPFVYQTVTVISYSTLCHDLDFLPVSSCVSAFSFEHLGEGRGRITTLKVKFVVKLYEKIFIFSDLPGQMNGRIATVTPARTVWHSITNHWHG